MGKLDKIFRASLAEELTQKVIGVKLFKDKLKQFGIDLNESQIEVLEDYIERKDLSNIKLEFTQDQIETIKNQKFPDGNIPVDFNENDFRKIETEINIAIREMIDNLVSNVVETIYEPIMSDRVVILEEDKQTKEEFSKEVIKSWGEALDLMRLFISYNEHLGNEFIEEYTQSDKREDEKAEVLLRLHARGLQISREILTLLENGYADGANARWRTLYEISVIVLFIEHHNETLASRYLDFESVEAYREAGEYQAHCQNLNREPIPPKLFRKIKNEYDKVIRKYGKQFSNDYGWAFYVFPQKTKLFFTDIERSVNYSHMRPLYRRACSNVHAGPRGIINQMGMPTDPDFLLLSGPSIFGLYDPGFDTVYTLSMITTALISIINNVDTIVTIKILMKFRDEVLNKLSLALERFEKQERSID